MPIAEEDATGIAALADPVRRRLYLFVCAQSGPVSRDQAAEAVGVPVHQAKFHLDKLEAEGLLESEYARLSGRRGPGAGRSSKLYRRTARQISVSLPDREYELAGRLMADAIDEAAATGQPVVDTLYRLAATEGRSMGEGAMRHTRSPRQRGGCAQSGCRDVGPTRLRAARARRPGHADQLPVSHVGASAHAIGVRYEPRADPRLDRHAEPTRPDGRPRARLRSVLRRTQPKCTPWASGSSDE